MSYFASIWFVCMHVFISESILKEKYIYEVYKIEGRKLRWIDINKIFFAFIIHIEVKSFWIDFVDKFTKNCERKIFFKILSSKKRAFVFVCLCAFTFNYHILIYLV